MTTGDERYRTLFDLASDGIFVADLDGRYVDVNEAGCRMLQCAREDIIGKTIVDFIPPDEVAKLADAKALLAAGRTQVAEWHLKKKDGAYLPVEVSAKIFPDGRWQGFVRDISKRKEAERKLAESVARERGLREEVERILAMSATVSNALASVPSSGFERALGVLVEEARAFTGARVGALGLGVDPDVPFEPWVTAGVDAAHFAGVHARPRPRGVLAIPPAGEIAAYDDVGAAARAGMPSGHMSIGTFLIAPIALGERVLGALYLGNKAVPFTDRDRNLVGGLAARAAAAVEMARLYESEAVEKRRLAALLEQLPEAVAVADAHGRVIVRNAASRALAVDEAPIAADGNRLSHDFCTREGTRIDPRDAPLRRVLRTGEPVAAEERWVRTAAGEIVPVLARARPVEVEGVNAGAVLVLRDLRAQKELERVREEWTSIVAHDLQQPITAIALTARVLLDRKPEPAFAEGITRISAAAERLSRMARDLLEDARINAGRFSINRASGDLVAVVERAVQNLRAGGVDVKLRVHGPVAALAFDAMRIEEVLDNLLSNAKKYGRAGTPVLVDVVDGGARVEVSVANEGAGIAPDQLPVLFQRFSRLRHTSSLPGSGLGLYIAKGIVEAHGGSMWVESVPGETTRFHFTIARVDQRG